MIEILYCAIKIFPFIHSSHNWNCRQDVRRESFSIPNFTLANQSLQIHCTETWICYNMLISLSFESLVWAFICCYLVDLLYMHIKHNFLSICLSNTKRRLHRISEIYHLIINLITKTMYVNNRYRSIEVIQKYLHDMVLNISLILDIFLKSVSYFMLYVMNI